MGLSGQLQAGLLAMHEGEAPGWCGRVMDCQPVVLYPWRGLLLVGLVGQLRGLVGLTMGWMLWPWVEDLQVELLDVGESGEWVQGCVLHPWVVLLVGGVRLLRDLVGYQRIPWMVHPLQDLVVGLAGSPCCWECLQTGTIKWCNLQL
jgi:hypothetical protein